MPSEELLDKLTRASEMEEDMAGVLIALCNEKEMPTDIPVESRKRIAGILAAIKNDTLRHKDIVFYVMERIRSHG